MLCYRCGSHVPDGSPECGSCGQAFAKSGRTRKGAGKASRKRRQPQAAGAFAVGDVIAGRYEVKGVVGEGPVGVVYRARDKEVEVQVAVKVLTSKLVQEPSEKKIFQREARIARALSHKNVIRLYDEAFDGPHPFVVMQYLEGLTLRKIIDLRVDKGQTFPISEIDPILQQLLDALAYSHGQRGTDGNAVAHADLKPSNVIVLPDLLKVCDFRQSLMVPRVPFVAAQRVRGGDAAYLAPEVAAGEPVTPAADLYSVGVLLGEMLTGKVYDPSVGLDLHVENDEVSVAFTSIFKRLTADKPRDRYTRIEHLLTDLALATEGKAPMHVGAFRAQVTRAEKLDSGPLQVLHTGEFEALDGSEPKETPQPPPGRKRESFGLESDRGMPSEAPPLDEEVEDEEAVLRRSRGISSPGRLRHVQEEEDDEEEAIADDDVLEEELLEDDDAFEDDEYEDDEYEDEDEPPGADEEEAVADGDIIEEEAPTGEGQAYPGDDDPPTRPSSEGLELLLRKREEEAKKEEEEGATVPKAPSIETLLAGDSVDAPPLLDDLLDAAHDIPSPATDTDPQAQALGPPVEQTGPLEIGAPPAAMGERPPTRDARRPAAKSAANKPRESSWTMPAMVAIGVIVGLGALAAFTEQGQALWARIAKQPVAAAEPEAADAGTPVVKKPLIDPAGASPTAPPLTDPAVGEVKAPAVDPSLAPQPGKGRPETATLRPTSDRSAREGSRSRKEARADARAEARARREAAEAEKRAAAEARRLEARDVAARKKAEQDAQMAEIVEQERRRQEAEKARRAGGKPKTGGGSSAFTFDTVDREMPVRSVGPDPKPPPKTGTGGSTPETPQPDTRVASAAPPPDVPQDVRCPKGMTYVSGGAFPFGSAVNDPMRNFAEKRLQQVQVVGFCIDRFEYGGQKPSTGVSWFRAKELCERRGKRLCTEEEWEKACKGPRGSRFPYGNVFNADTCNTEDADGNDRALVKPGTFRKCRSGHGVYDLAGNAAEWTSTIFQTGAAYRTIKGGAANRPDWDTRCATRGNRKPNTKDAFLGFRCCSRPK